MLGARDTAREVKAFFNLQRNTIDKLSLSLHSDGLKRLSLTEAVALFQKAHPAVKTRIHRTSLDGSEI